ncbi:CATRA system-associated protein [Frankia sp. R82]|uniref:CATRA system-associated protein n=1 Tax=Frankia sp. R82 TaxID=2950553 RepID=UPI002043D59B|nr:CATRA system-associated protein [Frankia sp. R82]MCM3884383.1 hypothetical protein [Frankia sp. R82]
MTGPGPATPAPAGGAHAGSGPDREARAEAVRVLRDVAHRTMPTDAWQDVRPGHPAVAALLTRLDQARLGGDARGFAAAVRDLRRLISSRGVEPDSASDRAALVGSTTGPADLAAAGATADAAGPVPGDVRLRIDALITSLTSLGLPGVAAPPPDAHPPDIAPPWPGSR